MSAESRFVWARVQEAEDLLVGLALPGTDGHAALLQLQVALGTGAAPARAVLDAGFTAVTAQATMSLRAGLSALAELRTTGEPPHWTTATAHEWRRYLRWLVATLDRAAAAGAVNGEWDRAGAACARAREVWGVVAGSVGPMDPAPGIDRLDTVVVGGRTYVSVDQLAGSMRARAGAFAEAAVSSAGIDDHLGTLVAEELAAELLARADALDVAGIDLAGIEVSASDGT